MSVDNTRINYAHDPSGSISDEALNLIADYLRGTCKSLGDAIEAFEQGELEEGVLESLLLNVDVEICVQCDWWHEVYELTFSEEHGGGLCEDCCNSLGIEPY